MTLTDLKRIAEAAPEWSSVTRLSPALCLALVAVAEAAQPFANLPKPGFATEYLQGHFIPKLSDALAHLDRMLAEEKA